ncbi:hypothetical protein [Flavobacterium sp. J27]|uniref:hypothetical protein n=1 Tax=Flavobacterium sp. J27 TaxID=2060419 RepID=UPI001031E9C7|nr:hypothetical protein [Flavobacterium sp. J27]
MNKAHLHMVFNHFPIIGLFFGIGILLYGIVKKQTILTNTAYVIFIICMIMGKVTMMTGEGAEEIVEKLGISHHMIHEHEEIAETFMKVLYLLGLTSIVGLFANAKKHAKAHFVTYFAIVVAIGAAILSKSVGTSGGEIRHTEIRENVANDGININHEAIDED